MEFSDNANGNLAYGWFWCWLGIVTCASSWVYLHLVDAVAVALLGLSALSSLIHTTSDTAFSTVLKVALGILFCWRVMKIVVLHGSPIPRGLQLTPGRENGGVSGRHVHISSIACGEKLWFGAVLRAHPASDKLARTRLEFLVLAMPFGRGLVVNESRIHWLSQSIENKRHRYFVRTAGKYWKKSEFKSPEQFRRDVVKHLETLSKHYGNGKRIVRSIDELRDVAKHELHPVTG